MIIIVKLYPNKIYVWNDQDINKDINLRFDIKYINYLLIIIFLGVSTWCLI